MKKFIFTASLLLTNMVFSQGDTPCTATTLTPSTTCSYSSGTTVGLTFATNSFGTPSCASAGTAPDGWYKFTCPSSGNVTITTTSGTMSDSGMSLYSATNCTTGASQITCDDDSGPGLMSEITATGLTSGAVYYIRIWQYSSGTGTFSICVQNNAPPANDDPCGAISLSTSSQCLSYTTGSTSNSTASSGVPAPGCASYSSRDVWYKVTVPSSGSLKINTTTGSITDLGMAVYSGACGSLSLVSCDDNSSNNSATMPLLILSGQTGGATLYIRCWAYGNAQVGTFGICVMDYNATCGNNATNDYCSNPAILTKGGSSFSSNTSSTYTTDSPSNLGSVFCGSIDNNSWYKFTAAATTETFNFTTVKNCVNAWGIQAEVYSLTAGSGGCCTSFSSKSNCFNPNAQVTGTVTASGLTIGNSYYLMVDGQAGDVCDFTISGWSATGVLPVKLVYFNGLPESNSNQLIWETASEINNDYFSLKRSFDGVDFIEIQKIKGNGNSNVKLNYSFDDRETRFGIVYYRLDQYDLNGNVEKSEIISIDRKLENSDFISLYPNPSKDYFIVEFKNEDNQYCKIEIIDQMGKIIEEKVNKSEGLQTLSFETKEYENGLYFLKYSNDLVGTRIVEFVINK